MYVCDEEELKYVSIKWFPISNQISNNLVFGRGLCIHILKKFKLEWFSRQRVVPLQVMQLFEWNVNCCALQTSIYCWREQLEYQPENFFLIDIIPLTFFNLNIWLSCFKAFVLRWYVVKKCNEEYYLNNILCDKFRHSLRSLTRVIYKVGLTSTLRLSG